MAGRLDRFVARTVLVCAGLAVLAFGVNHVQHPCEVGMGGLCVVTASEVSR
ncbi:hypothetical protein [Micromonospora sp. NPDC004704]